MIQPSTLIETTPQTDEPRQGMDRGIQILGTFVVKVPKDVQRRLFFRSGGNRRPISFSVLEPRFGSRGAVLGSWVFFPQFLGAASCKKL